MGRELLTKTLEFIFDFASPNAYLAMKALPPILERTGAALKITPALLGGIFKATGNSAPMVQYGGVPSKLAYERLEMERFIAAHQLTAFRFNPHFPVNSLLIMRAAMVAEADGRLAAYVDAVLGAMWEDGLNMSDPEIVSAFLSANGFDRLAMLTRASEQAAKDALAANTAAAVERGVFGIPSFFVGDQMFFGKDRLDQVEAALAYSQKA
jgi:2-hydroxychromene-2-carboxylate isomerase